MNQQLDDHRRTATDRIQSLRMEVERLAQRAFAVAADPDAGDELDSVLARIEAVEQRLVAMNRLANVLERVASAAPVTATTAGVPVRLVPAIGRHFPTPRGHYVRSWAKVAQFPRTRR